ncbi:hypothetical protein KJ766_03050, partial [Patescibacteria group bacterium]|nr:hypothetical protein [Patescibacteria group bacterium]
HEIKMIVERFVYSFERFRLSLVQTRDHIERNEKNIERIFSSIFDDWKNKVTSISRILNSFHVENILRRGFSIVRYGTDVLKDSSRLAKGDEISIQLARGSITSTVKERK